MSDSSKNGKAPPTEDAVKLLAEVWLKPDSHKRHDAFRDLIGGLLRAGMAPSAVEALVEALCEQTGDEEVQKRVALVGDTAEKLRTPNARITGRPSLIKRLGDKGAEVVNRVWELLGLERRIVAEYDYTDEAGCLLYQVVRWDPKDFSRRRRDGKGGWVWNTNGVPTVLYRLPELVNSDPAETAFVCEGEKDVDNVRCLGLVATTNPGGAGTNKWRDDYNGPLHGRHVVILPHNDDQGTEHAEQVARSLHGGAASVKVLMLPGLPKAGDVSDWIAADGTGEELLRLAKVTKPWQGSGAPATPALPRLPPEPPWPDPPDEAAFHGLVGDMVRTIGPHSEADPVALLGQGLIAFGNAIGRTAHFRVEGDTHYLNEFGVLVGKTGKGRKGTSWGQISQSFAEVLEDWFRNCVTSGASSGEGIIWAVRDPITTRHPVKEKGRVVGYEEVESDPGVADKRLMLIEAEFATVLKQPERKGNTLSAIFRQAWETGNIRSLTKNSPARATGAHVSIIGHITAAELRRYLTATEAANGFGNRFLWFCVQRSKCLPRGGRVPESAWNPIRERLRKAIEFATKTGEMGFDDEAEDAWAAVYPELSEGQPGLAGDMLSRGEAHVMRLACLYALLDLSAEVRQEHLEAALALWEYAEASVRYVFGAALGDPLADELYQALRACPAGLTRTEIRDLCGRHQGGDRIGHALALLLRAGMAHMTRQETAGRPTERWFAGRGDATEATKATKGGAAP
jgi:hypothetical protein